MSSSLFDSNPLPSRQSRGRPSLTATRREVSMDANLGIPGLAQASLKGKWEFGKNRGALLIMARARLTHIPGNSVLELLRDLPTMADKLLVTDVTSCHAYTLYLSTKNSGVITLALIGTFPVPGTLCPTVSGDIKWHTEHVTGVLNSACAKEDKFSPLFIVKKILKRRTFLLFRDGPVVDPTGDDCWVNARPPWDALDEDGNEEPFEDTIFYDEGEEQPERDVGSSGV